MSANIWTRIEKDISLVQKETPRFAVWSLLGEKLNLAKYRPVRISDAEVAEVSSTASGKHYILRNPQNDKYISIGEEELFLWNLMDGQNTVKDLAIEYITRYNALGQEVILNFLGLLKSNGFLQEKPAPVLRSLIVRLQQKKFLGKLLSVIGFFTHRTFTTKLADIYFIWLYKYVARPLFTFPALVILLILLVCDLGFFLYFVFFLHAPILLSPTVAGTRDYIIMMVIIYIALAIHEQAHGLVVKHYGRKVLRAGVLLYFGSPIAYVDTTDIWMRSKGPRIAVSFAGPASNGILGGIFFLIAFITDSAVENIFVQVGVINSITFMLNLLPIAETDGHYIIQDYLNMPRLRTNSLTFMRRGLWGKLVHREPWTKNDYIYLAYGLLAIAGVVLLIYTALQLWLSAGESLVKAVISHPRLIAEIFAFLIAITTFVAILRYGLPWTWRTVRLENVLKKHLRVR